MMNNDAQLELIVRAIRNRRETLNYSQEYMAYKMGMGQNCYSKIGLGHNKLTVDRLLTICTLLDIQMPELLEMPQQLQKVS